MGSPSTPHYPGKILVLRFKKTGFGSPKCQRPYHVEHTSSRPITEVKQRWVQSVLGWVTAWEHWMLLASFLFSSTFLFKISFFFSHPVFKISRVFAPKMVEKSWENTRQILWTAFPELNQIGHLWRFAQGLRTFENVSLGWSKMALASISHHKRQVFAPFHIEIWPIWAHRSHQSSFEAHSGPLNLACQQWKPSVGWFSACQMSSFQGSRASVEMVDKFSEAYISIASRPFG